MFTHDPLRHECSYLGGLSLLSLDFMFLGGERLEKEPLLLELELIPNLFQLNSWSSGIGSVTVIRTFL